MSQSQIEEAPYYRGKTLTPESPRPLHPPEPANIRILQNQIDPIFNLMSTHMDPPYASRDLTAMDQSLAGMTATEMMGVESNENHDVAQTQGEAQVATSNMPASMAPFLVDGQQNNMSPDAQNSHGRETSASDPSLIAMISGEVGAHATNVASHASNTSLPAGPSDAAQQAVPLSTDSAEVQVAHGQSATDDPMLGQEQTSPQAHVVSESVNYQALLDSLTSQNTNHQEAALGNPESANNSEQAASTEDPALGTTNPTSATLSPAPGLPPRPPPQEKPSIHPNYKSGEDIRSYHLPQAQPPNGSQSQTPQAVLPSPSFPPTTAASLPGANGLPPPPMPSFQHAPGTQSLQSLTQQIKTSEDFISLSGSAMNSADARYSQFLEDESKYTAEGRWDSFPPGSRLFVGRQKRVDTS